MTSSFDDIMKELGIETQVTELGEMSIANEVASEISEKVKVTKARTLPRWAWIYETNGIRFLNEAGKLSIRVKEETERLRNNASNEFKKAFQCWRAIINLNQHGNRISKDGVKIIIDELQPELDANLYLAFRLAVSGLLSDQTALVRLELSRFEDSNDTSTWKSRVVCCVFQAFILLTRKSNGWSDIDKALKQIAQLKELQSQFEEEYLNSKSEDQILAAVELVGYYHLAQLINITGDYLVSGKPGEAATRSKLDKHYDNAEKAFNAAGKESELHLVRLLSLGCRQLCRNSIWSHAAAGPVKQFVQVLADKGRPTPILELWPAQQKALHENVLSPYHRAILVEMPTSAGKTLLAKFAIVQTKALNPDGTIVYVVPTRALVNQITFDLRSDFGDMQNPLQVEQTIPAFELDPTEDKLLESQPDILVTTPEKLDFLLRKEHISVSNLVMVIADEAHNIGGDSRGTRLELLLGMIKRDVPDARFLLLSPFLPENDILLEWLGEEMALDAITVDWKPSNRIVGGIALRGSGKNRRLTLETLEAADNSDIGGGKRIPIGSADLVEGDSTVEKLTGATISALKDRGSVFVLCRGKKTASDRAGFIASTIDEVKHSDKLEAVCRYIETEAGTETKLVQCLKKGVAYHHAGLSHETRWLIERLAKESIVEVICGTTTLAQGVNFPISTVLVEDLRKGDKQLTYSDFWNIAGRAGRTLVDTVGIVGFPLSGAQAKRRYQEFLKGEAAEIVSQLADVITRVDQLGRGFDLAAVSQNPGLSYLLQYLAHAMKVAGRTDLADEVEEIMRCSLIYHQLRKSDQEKAVRLIEICRSYLDDLGSKKNILQILQIADKTGFATPSVFRLLAEKRTDKTLADVDTWKPDALFGPDISQLTKRIEILGDLPEIKLGTAKPGDFRPDLIAQVVRDWVQGDDLHVMCQRYPHLVKEGVSDDQRLVEFSQFLFSALLGKASWGLGALESLYLSNSTDEEWEEVGYVPAMVFYGVKKKESIWLRMSGVPRAFADGLATIWTNEMRSAPTSYSEIRNWVTELSDKQWEAAIPQASRMRPEDCRVIWKELSGSR